MFDSGDPWRYANRAIFALTATHEIGHVLGLDHSNRLDSIMFPNANLTWAGGSLDPETVQVLRDLYGWSAAASFPDLRASAFAPALAVTATGQLAAPDGITVHMVWSGVTGDPSMHYSRSDDRGRTWTNQQRMRGVATPVFGPALAAYPGGAGGTADRLFLAWAGEGGQLWHTPHLADPTNVTSLPVEQHSSDARPALAFFAGAMHMVWKSNGDSRIWHASHRDGRWGVAVVLADAPTIAAPALAATRDELVMLFATPGGMVFASRMTANGVWTPPWPVEHFVFVDAGGIVAQVTGRGRIHTSHAPATAAVGGDDVLAVRLENGQIATMRNRGGFTGPIAMEGARSDRGPSIVGVDTGVLCTWITQPGEVLHFAIREDVNPAPRRSSPMGLWRVTREG